MLEVVFSDSVKGSMRMAKNYRASDFGAVSVGYIGGEPSEEEMAEFLAEQKRKQSRGRAVGGNPQDVVCIGFALDVGALSGGMDDGIRKTVYQRLWGRFSFDQKRMEEFFSALEEDCRRLVREAEQGKLLRIWKSRAPYAVCGFSYLCYLLRNIPCEMRVIEMPEPGRDWGDVEPGELYRYLPCERRLDNKEKVQCAENWERLIHENAPLRAEVNGVLCSVDEDFYDPWITACIPEGKFLMGRLIGEILTKYPLGVSDSWYALRIEKMIGEGRLEVVSHGDGTHPYGCWLRKK